MPYIFSEQQIDRCHHLLTFHNMDAEQIADIMNTSIVSARHLIKLANRRHLTPKHKSKPEQLKKYQHDRGVQSDTKKQHIVLIRPKAEYSNKRIYDLI